ncbi:DUF3237 domain-containing protein [Niveispirillum sp. KHB5.9]|uniref:DUF3237 domain-containing protein n=1 Tax=Niveispirillum sp. KHB5.9 TaxID=3400269 RepID=UPI003A89104A
MPSCPVASVAGAAEDYPEPGLSFAFQIDVELGPVQEQGTVDGLRRRIVPITGGRVAGPRLAGRVMPGGADWQGIRPADGLTRVHACHWLQAGDGAVIGVENRSLRRAPPDVMRRLMAGEAMSPRDYYFRATPAFEVGDGPHRWLNESLFICVGARRPDRAIIRVYEVT